MKHVLINEHVNFIVGIYEYQQFTPAPNIVEGQIEIEVFIAN